MKFKFKKLMTLENCENCEYHVDTLTDSILCRFEACVNYRPLNRDRVVGCPLAEKKK